MQEISRPTYGIARAKTTPELLGLWDGPVWGDVEALSIDHFHAQSSDHRPKTRAKAVYNEDGLYLLFDVQDQYVRCVHTEFQSMVCLDSCVEFFVQPAGLKGYFNFEFNCGGTLLVHYVTDPTRTPTGLKESVALTPEQVADLRVWHSLPRKIDAEIAVPTSWRLEVRLPWSIFGQQPGPNIAQWRGNFYKCGDNTSHPHWAAWADVAPDLNFHQPRLFGFLLWKLLTCK